MYLLFSYCIAGVDAPISDIIDFISAAQIAESSEKNVQIANCRDDEKNMVMLIQVNRILFLLVNFIYS